MKNIFLVSLIGLLLACGTNPPKEEIQANLQNVNGVSINSDQFNSQFKLFLHSYYDLKDAFIKEEMVAINATADSLAKQVNQILIKELKSDSTQKAAQILIESIKAELIGLKGETDIEEKRKAFQMIGEQLLVLIQTVQYDNEIIYNQFCPMAMNDNGATWLSNSADIKNPYLPKTMLECGEVKDTLNNPVK
jgi:Cu(I)/Ag(I) efflux system membrane fusion protein